MLAYIPYMDPMGISSNFRPLLLLVLITPKPVFVAAREVLGGMNHMGRTSKQPSGKTFFTILDHRGHPMGDWVGVSENGLLP